MDRVEAFKATRNGVIAAHICGYMTLAFGLYAMFIDSGDFFGLLNDPTIFISVAIIFACAWGISRQSRLAAVVLLVFYVLSRIDLSMQAGQVAGLLMTLVLVYFFGKAVQGTFAYHRIERAENPHYKPGPRWVLYGVAPLALVMLAVHAIGILSMNGVLPSYEVQAGHDLRAKHQTALVSNGIVYSNESIEYIYTDGMMSVLQGGSVLTDRRVFVYYPEDDGQMGVYGFYFDEIAHIEQIHPGGLLEYAVYRIVGHDPETWIQVTLSPDNHGDVKFIEALRANVNDLNY